MTLNVEYFDTDSSSYKHRLKLKLSKDAARPRVFADDTGILNARDEFEQWHYIPLRNVKQYWTEVEEVAA